MAKAEPILVSVDFKPRPDSRWRHARPGQTFSELLGMGFRAAELRDRVAREHLRFDRPLPARSKRGGGRPPRTAPPPGHKVRPCMCCGKTFPSEGPHNRMCGPCRMCDASPFEPG